MIDTETMDRWFTYHPPNLDTGPKYAAMRHAQHETLELLSKALTGSRSVNTIGELQPFFEEVTQATRGFADVLNAMGSPSADLTAAIRCVRIARMAANEAMLRECQERRMGQPQSLDTQHLHMMVMGELYKARWQASSSLACAT